MVWVGAWHQKGGERFKGLWIFLGFDKGIAADGIPVPTVKILTIVVKYASQNEKIHMDIHLSILNIRYF